MKRPAHESVRAGIGPLPLDGPAFQAAAAQASAEIVIHAPADRVWHVLTNVDDWPRWNPAVDRSHLEGALAPGSVFRWRSQRFTVTSTLIAVDAPTQLVWTGKAFGTKARHTWEIAPSERGVVVRTSETFDGWLPRVMPATMQKQLEGTLLAWLDALRKEAESR